MTNARLVFMVFVAGGFSACAQTALQKRLPVNDEQIFSTWQEFLSNPNICNPARLQEQFHLQGFIPATAGQVEFLTPNTKLISRVTYSGTARQAGKGAIFSVIFAASNVCFHEDSLLKAYGRGINIPAMDHKYSEDELRNPSKFPHQTYFPQAVDGINVNAIMGANQCIERLTVEQQSCGI